MIAGTAGALAALTLLVLTISVRAQLEGLGLLLPPVLRQHFDDLVKAASDTCEALPLEILFSRQATLESPKLDVVEFTRTTNRKYRATKAHLKLRELNLPSLVLYIPGWWNTPADESSHTLVDALLNKNGVVLLLDTRLSFSRGYVAAASRVNAISHVLYSFIKNIHQDGFLLSSIHLIGFSLGAHVAGLTGKLVQENLNGKIGRITALDPAKPCFARTETYRLDKNDAKFVHVVHSSSGVLGLEEPVGHADVYINGISGKQPECKDRSISVECDHSQAWKLFSASVTNEKSLTGSQCLTWNELVRQTCSGNETEMGYDASIKSRGVFLYKSQGGETRKTKIRLQVFNPFDFKTWWHHI